MILFQSFVKPLGLRLGSRERKATADDIADQRNGLADAASGAFGGDLRFHMLRNQMNGTFRVKIDPHLGHLGNISKIRSPCI